MDRSHWLLLSAVLLLCSTTTCCAQKPNVGKKKHDVYVAGFFPFGKGVENSETGRGVMPSVKLALDNINEHRTILKKHRLHMWWNDTMEISQKSQTSCWPAGLSSSGPFSAKSLDQNKSDETPVIPDNLEFATEHIGTSDKFNPNTTSTSEVEINAQANKAVFCYYCESYVQHFPRHLSRNHRSELEVQKLLALPLLSKERKDLLFALRKKGNYLTSHETTKPVRKGDMETRYLPCIHCLGFYSARNLWRHRRQCAANPSKGNSGQNLQDQQAKQSKEQAAFGNNLSPRKASGKSPCNAAVGVKAFFDMMHSGPHKVMLFGAACTHVTDPIAKASKHWRLTQLSYADTHPMFTKHNFPNFFRIVPSENAFNSPRLSLLKEFNWTRVGTIYQDEPRYSLAHNRLVSELDTLGYQVVETQSFTNEVATALGKLKEKDTRIILGNFNEKWARTIFCEAYKMEMFGRRYQWIIVATYSNNWWKKKETEHNCTLDELETALKQTILTDLLPLSTSGEITINGDTAEDYLNEYNLRRGLHYSRFHGYTYDGLWAVALAIQNVAFAIKDLRPNQTVNDFRYRDEDWERLFLDALKNTSFEGVTGPVRFYDNERRASILLKQFQEGCEIKVGEYNAATQHLDLTLGTPLKWIGKYPPKDRTLLIIEHTRINKTAYAVLATLAVCGIVMAAIFLMFNIKYRNQRYIKMSSPQLNNLIIIGCMLTYTSIIFLGLDSGLSSIEIFPYICAARVWTLMSGFTLAFGAMFSKTWRVHSIFTDVKLNKKIIQDYKLFIVVGVLLLLDIVIMLTWQFSDPFYRETKQMEPYHHTSSEDIVVIPENEYCASDHMTIFVGLIYVYKGVLMVFGAFLAWETRHVSIPALNDSRHVGLSVYNVAIMCICGAAVALVLIDHQDALFLIIGVFVLFCTTGTLVLVFVPKMVELRRNPGGSIDKRIRATLRPMSKTRRDSSVSELETKIKDVKVMNSKYRKTLMEKDSELQMLIDRLGNEAREILEAKENAMFDSNRLSVPLLRKEPPSATETSDITSLCSISSQDLVSLHHSDSQKKKRPASGDSPRRADSKMGTGVLTTGGDATTKPTQNGEGPPSQVDDNYNSVLGRLDRNSYENHAAAAVKQTSIAANPQNIEVDGGCKMAVGDPRRLGRAADVITDVIPLRTADRRRMSTKADVTEDTCQSHRRVSVPTNRITPPKKRAECGTHVVAKSELWDTGSQHRCPKSHQKNNRVSISQEEDDQHMHRSVSEKNRHPQKQREKSPVPKKETSPSSMCPKVGYFQSTPNVASIKTSALPPKRDKSMYNATSESELLDREILPIFQKLLTERNKSQHNIDYSFGRSCPNISIKCDIVEYL